MVVHVNLKISLDVDFERDNDMNEILDKLQDLIIEISHNEGVIKNTMITKLEAN